MNKATLEKGYVGMQSDIKYKNCCCSWWRQLEIIQLCGVVVMLNFADIKYIFFVLGWVVFVVPFGVSVEIVWLCHPNVKLNFWWLCGQIPLFFLLFLLFQTAVWKHACHCFLLRFFLGFPIVFHLILEQFNSA